MSDLCVLDLFIKSLMARRLRQTSVCTELFKQAILFQSYFLSPRINLAFLFWNLAVDHLLTVYTDFVPQIKPKQS